MMRNRLFSDYISELTCSSEVSESDLIYVSISCLEEYTKLVDFITRAVASYDKVTILRENFPYQDEDYTHVFFYFEISRDDFKSFVSFMDEHSGEFDGLATTVWCKKPFDPKADIYERYEDSKNIAYIRAKKTYA